MTSNPPQASDSLLDLLLPFWQPAIGLLVLMTVVVSIRRIMMRGPSRMGGALLLIAGAVVCVALLGYVVQGL